MQFVWFGKFPAVSQRLAARKYPSPISSGQTTKSSLTKWVESCTETLPEGAVIQMEPDLFFMLHTCMC